MVCTPCLKYQITGQGAQLVDVALERRREKKEVKELDAVVLPLDLDGADSWISQVNLPT